MNITKELKDEVLQKVTGGENPDWNTYKIQRGNVFFGTIGGYYTANENEGGSNFISVQFFMDEGTLTDTLESFPVDVLKTYNFFAQSDSRFPPKE